MLWELCKQLSKECPIYIDYMNEDENSSPQDYVLIKENEFESNFAFADGKPALKQTSFTINIHCKTRSKLPAILSSYRTILYSNNISFNQTGPFYEPETGATSVALSGNYVHG